MDRAKLLEAKDEIKKNKESKPVLKVQNDADDVANLPDSPMNVQQKRQLPSNRALLQLSTEQMLNDIKRKQAAEQK